MTKRQEIFYGTAAAMMLAAALLIETRPILAISAIVIGWASVRLAN